MKFVLAILFSATISIACMAQDNIIGVPIVIKKGETQKSGRLQIKYLGGLEDGNGNISYHFEVTDNDKKYDSKEISRFEIIEINGLVVEILEEMPDKNAVKIKVITKDMYRRKSMEKLTQWQHDYEKSKEKRKELEDFSQANSSESYPIYVNISVKKSVAEFSFFVMHSEKNEGDEFIDVFFKRIAVTDPKLNKIQMKMIPKKIGIVYQVNVKESKQKYKISFSHSGNRYEGVIELNSTVTDELNQIKFYRKQD